MAYEYLPYGRQDISSTDIEAVLAVLQSEFLTQGPAVPAFEQAVTNYCGATHGVAANSATSALHLACLALGVGPGERVWTSPITFVASANCARYCGAQVDFIDIDPRTYNISAAALAEKLARAEPAGQLPHTLIAVHLCGQPCDMKAIATLAQRYRFRVIEDASHAIGARYLGEPVGNCRYSDITVFSFHPVKIITTGEGGLATTNQAALARRMALLRSHGITRESAEMDHPPDGPWYYQQIGLGFNYRMTDIQAALGVSQMERLEEFLANRRRLARRYDQLLGELPVTLPYQPPFGESAYHLYPILIDAATAGIGRGEVFESLQRRGIGVNVHYIPVHTQPYYRSLGFRDGQFPNAERYYAGAISLPLHPGLTEIQQDRIVDALRRALQENACGSR
ncbi:MAG: UDP-4-amino-4,6-dideoxy-N-acetyl-beta-L-altrosamine transaminase [Methylococcaceae bacterium]|nr:UDP-4-amino-4,6-dideoxy-N-acetyl-beta-L-altrosamine transaminase [Methylococcaceae bacterium]